MKKDASEDFRRSPEFWEKSYQLVFGHLPEPTSTDHLVLVQRQGGRPYFAIVAQSRGHQEAVDLAMQAFIARGNRVMAATHGSVYGPWEEADCGCGGAPGCDFRLLPKEQ